MEILRPFTVHKVAGADPERFRIDYHYPEHYSGPVVNMGEMSEDDLRTRLKEMAGVAPTEIAGIIEAARKHPKADSKKPHPEG